MNGKDKCKILKDIRRQIAENNDIEWAVNECTHKGNCKGTCPKCEAEVRKLEHELSIRRKLGKAVAISGVSAACMAGLTACSPQDVIDTGIGLINEIRDHISPQVNISEPIELDGEVAVIDDLSGYMEPDVPDEPETEELIELDGEVAVPDTWGD